MIRQPVDAELFLVTQNDHAELAGRLAGRWGNGRFDPPEPRGDVLAGIALHDAGWPLHDNQPTLNGRGEPLDVFEVPAGIAVRVWSASADRAQAGGDYAALLVSLHVLSLSTLAPARPRTRHELFGINKFQHREVERQETLRNRLGLSTHIPLKYGLAAPGAGEDEDRLRFSFALLQAADRLSLALCAGPKRALFPRIDRVQARIGGPAVTLELRHHAGRWSVDPWPFDADSLSLEIPRRRVPAKPFDDADEIRRAFSAADVERLRLMLCAP